MATKFSEQPDLDTVASWLRDREIRTTRFPIKDTRVSKTPDFKLWRKAKLVAFCEVKSPNDPWLDDMLADASPFEIVGGARNDPTYNRLVRLINKADRQFVEVNGARLKLNILAYVNHDTHSDVNDLYAVLRGYIRTNSGDRIHIRIKNRAFNEAKQRIDAHIWFDAKLDREPHIVINSSDHLRSTRTKQLLKVAPTQNIMA